MKKNKPLRLFEVERWNLNTEKLERVVVIARSQGEAERKMHPSRLGRVEDFV